MVKLLVMGGCPFEQLADSHSYLLHSNPTKNQLVIEYSYRVRQTAPFCTYDKVLVKVLYNKVYWYTYSVVRKNAVQLDRIDCIMQYLVAF